MTSSSGADESGRGRGSVTGAPTPPAPRASSADLAGTEQLGEDAELLVGADIAESTDSSFTVLERETCFNLLATRGIGRVAFTIEGDAAPTVLPVNYALLDDTIVFRSNLAGTIMRHGRGYAAFEVDHFDHEHFEGWSVLASGRCRWIRDDGELSRIPQGRLAKPWAAGKRDQVLKIVPGRISGRRISRS
ncbi:nitroimidazol reductase NimA-like FMN-containing flavoprotein (pyridoxamine 5'-phosphate oxidase superfamily) [Nocardiopsis sp. Huas11]|uniref:pyridoxamine 5'-phosphate oxidase family protein n=1 Tax=Nocardiopsis sp. Huas11 TaxID=2183912 RepID=UPI000EB133C8|nr:pyridoxamine 5'-phosphate oxidase family protein [Nocardiopsis sp. Huas11]RKS08992.1 nitroimidazol reductase NimA-like FMN-containing flavoprotein (pyridoxamine 5'-phosphate oxidase superfamily) [Nocardiopsis sp. Huas11]